MTLTFDGILDRAATVQALDAVAELMSGNQVADDWAQESVLRGMTVGGLARHLVSQPECAVEFLGADQPAGAQVLTLADYYKRVDWLGADVEAPENTSIRDDFNEMAEVGPNGCRQILQRAWAQLPGAIASAGATTYVPWQDCALLLDDFLVCRLMEIVVHTDDLAQSLGIATPRFDAAVLDPVVALLAELSVRRRGQDAVLRALSRHERALGSVSAF